jgi:hypothetical protein
MKNYMRPPGTLSLECLVGIFVIKGNGRSSVESDVLANKLIEIGEKGRVPELIPDLEVTKLEKGYISQRKGDDGKGSESLTNNIETYLQERS